MRFAFSLLLIPILLPVSVQANTLETFHVRVLECVPQKASEELRDGLVEHIACGQDKARVLLQSKHKVKPGQTVFAENKKMVPFSGHKPAITKTADGFRLKPEHFIERKESGTELKLHFIEVMDNRAKVSVEASVTEWRSRERVAWFNEDKVYINTEPAQKKRFVVATGFVGKDDPEILSGDVWLNAPATQKTLTRLPEQARLWIEVSLKP